MKKQLLSPQATIFLERVALVLKENPGLSERAWSLAATGKSDTIRNVRRGGSSMPGIDKIEQLAAYVEVNSDWLRGKDHAPKIVGFTEERFTPPSEARANRVAMLGYIGAGDKVYHFGVAEAAEREIEVPPDVVRGIGGIVRGKSMIPVYRDGDLVVGVEMLGNGDELIGRDCFVQVREGPLYLKILRRGTKPNHFNLESYNPSEPVIRNQPVEWVAPVRWIKRK